MATSEQEPPDGVVGSKDGVTYGDNDKPYTFNRLPKGDVPFPFTQREYAKLTITKSLLRENSEMKNDHPNIKNKPFTPRPKPRGK